MNPAQADAVQTLDGPLLVVAGAGSGKTRVLTQRVAHLIASGKAQPEEILAVTFTNKAAKEMEARILQSLQSLRISIREPLWVSTFHSFCARVLRSDIELLQVEGEPSYRSHFTIYDDSDQLTQIKRALQELQIDEKVLAPKTLRNKISQAKMLGLRWDSSELRRDLRWDSRTVDLYRTYERAMRAANALDFDDLLFKTHELFLNYPGLLETYQKKFRYILVDEYQDTNHIQYLLVQALAKAHRNLCVVGDEDQSIYSWRGADVKNILEFERDFPEAKVVKLEQNYRSTATIVNSASKLIANNSMRKPKTLFTEQPKGDPIFIREEKNEYDEARWVVQQIQAAANSGQHPLSDFAIFYRTNAQSRVLEEQLRTVALPYQIVGGTRFYDRLEIKDMISYMKVLANPRDDVALARIINVPTRGIGKTTVDRLIELGMLKKTSLRETIESAILDREFNSGTTSKLRNFVSLLEELKSASVDTDLLEYYRHQLDRTGYLEKLEKENSTEAETRINNLEELANAIGQFCQERAEPSLQEFLQEMALVSDLDSLSEQVPGVTLMTLHVSKGLEFPVVFIVGMEENLFPSGGADNLQNPEDLEEERRLAYVGLTRARQRLALTYCRSRRLWGMEQYNSPSRFLAELPKEMTQFTSALATPSFMSRHQRDHEARLGGARNGGYGGNSSYGAERSGQKKLRLVDSEEYQEFPDHESGEDSSPFQRGQRVRHPIFGSGTIYTVEGSGADVKVSVVFQDQSIKKFVAKYAKLEIL